MQRSLLLHHFSIAASTLTVLNSLQHSASLTDSRAPAVLQQSEATTAPGKPILSTQVQPRHAMAWGGCTWRHQSHCITRHAAVTANCPPHFPRQTVPHTSHGKLSPTLSTAICMPHFPQRTVCHTLHSQAWWHLGNWPWSKS